MVGERARENKASESVKRQDGGSGGRVGSGIVFLTGGVV